MPANAKTINAIRLFGIVIQKEPIKKEFGPASKFEPGRFRI